MIVAFDELAQYRHRVAMVDGAFDPLHRGHIEYFRAAAQLDAPLLCFGEIVARRLKRRNVTAAFAGADIGPYIFRFSLRRDERQTSSEQRAYYQRAIGFHAH